MLAHLIKYKGKGYLVLVLPLFTAFLLFLIFNGMALNDKYVGAISLLLSSFIIWFIDDGPEALRNGFKRQDTTGKNTFMWIEIKYWAIVLGIAGCISLGVIVGK